MLFFEHNALTPVLMKPVKFFFMSVGVLLVFWLQAGFAQEVFYNHFTQQIVSMDQGDGAVPSPRDFYMKSEPAEVKLESDFTRLMANKLARAYQPATLHVRFSDSISMRCAVRIKPRGKSRLEFCDQPPLKIDFRESGLSSTSLKNLEKVKLVSNCKQGLYYDKYVFREFLAYKLYNQLTPKSFRVRLARIEFVDTGSGGKTWENYGFIIEETDALARREQLVEIEEPGTAQAFDRNGLAVLSMFQYMIGNTDWHLPSQHNIKWFEDTTTAGKPVYAVPFDFDLSGLVESEYAQPHTTLNQSHVKERVFICSTMEEGDLEEMVNVFQSRKPFFYQVIEDFTQMGKRDKKNAARYLDGFFKTLDNPKKRQKCFVEQAFPYDW